MTPGGHKFPVERRPYLDSEERRSYLNPRAILRAFRVRPGMRIADIGSGTGFFALPAAEAVGRTGHVHAVDLSPEMLEDLEAKLSAQRITNVTVVRSTEDRISLADRSVDFAFLACILHELDGPGTLLEARRILRPQGRLGIVDWKKEAMAFGPPVEHRLDENEAKAILRDAGFTPTRAFPAGPYHYAIEARVRHA
ncbi:MAG TPA: class I SAM-dependent methyltransferase [Thermoplasmata archaeon]|nr:class I SAM-dependent methyltransferase [Thermoplasmata archaeon]